MLGVRQQPTPVTVAVVSWNGREQLSQCLRSLEPDSRAGRAEVWVADNASSDGSPELVEREFPWVNLLRLGRNMGYGPAVNAVAARTQRPWIAPANQDIELEPGALQALIEAGRANPRAGMVAPRLILSDGSTQQSLQPLPTLTYTLLANLGLAGLSRRYAESRCHPGRVDFEVPREVPWVLAAFLLVRRQAFDAIGRFDADQWLHAEDLSLGWRMIDAGWTNRYEPRARVRHGLSMSTRQAYGEHLESHFTVATYAWLERYRGRARARATAAVNVIGAFARYAVATFAALVRPGRYSQAPAFWRRRAAIHLLGLRPRRYRCQAS
jgi:GT2 family glycosyltransferase